ARRRRGRAGPGTARARRRPARAHSPVALPCRICKSMNLLDFLVSPAAAQAVGTPAQPSPYSGLIMIGLMFVFFWFFLIRPQMKRAKEHRELLSRLEKGDEVMTSGGIAGRITELGDSLVTVEIAPSVTIKVQRQAITAVLPKGTLKSA